MHINSRPCAIVANWDWVIYNFRLPLAKTLAENGVDIVFVCPPGKYFEKMEALGYTLIPWKLKRRSTNPLKELFAFFSLLSIYRKSRFRAVHHFTIKPILYGSIAARVVRIPIIINNFTGLGYLFTEATKAKIILSLITPIFRITFNSSQIHTVFQNPQVKKILTDKKIVSKENAHVISGTGVDLTRFPKTRNRETPKRPVVFMAARLLYDKGVVEFAKSSEILRGQGFEVDFQIAGSADTGNPSSISQKTIGKWMKSGDVNFLGHRNDIPRLLQNADIAVLPSYHEGVPLFLLEAAASGLPIVASDIEGCRMIVTPELNGYLVPIKDELALARAIRQLLFDKKLREKMGNASRKIAEEKFDIRKINYQYIELYKKLGIVN